MGVIADGSLLDTLRRVKAFGVHLVRLDIRQESTRHADVLSELTRYLGIGDYEQWSEQDKIAFLTNELASKRPLLPRDWEPSEPVKEVLDTCKIIALQPREASVLTSSQWLVPPQTYSLCTYCCKKRAALTVWMFVLCSKL